MNRLDTLLNRLDEWANRRYYSACGTWRWRFWFEVTGQGRAARRYTRMMDRDWERWAAARHG